MFKFTISHKYKNARIGLFETPNGILQTPNLAIVGTDGVFKSISRDETSKQPIDYAIVNTFHIYVKNILQEIESVGGIHIHMNYNNICASDSGGYQVFSLGFGKKHNIGKIGDIFSGQTSEVDDDNPLEITEEGVIFHFDGKNIELTPEKSMEIQHKIGADIIFAFDECTSTLNSQEYVSESLDRTHRWLDRCITHHKKNTDKQALFGIVQGSYYKDLRIKAVKHLSQQDVGGFGIGGSLGKTKKDMYNILEWIIPILPIEKPRHLLGIGTIEDIFESVERGVDLFDCVIPTREARHRNLYTLKGKICLRADVRSWDEIIDSREGSPTLEDGITYKQLAQWFTEKDPRAYNYATKHNIFFYNRLMKEIRESIEMGSFEELKAKYFKIFKKDF